MREDFDIVGLFYQIGELKFRKYLDIKLKSSILKTPDIMVVMMNPGSSYPLNRIDDNTVATLAEPDDTQDQIMKVMSNTSFEYARILNLSDLRTPDSNELYSFLKSESANSIPHSIFSDERKSDFEYLFIRGVPVIYGWGVNRALKDLSKLAIKKIDHPNPIGLLKTGTSYAYYHPLPRIYKNKLEWVVTVTHRLSRT